MSNAAIYLHTDGYRTDRPALMGRHSAGESFLRGFIRHADVDQFHFWKILDQKNEAMNDFVQSVEPTDKPITWIERHDRRRVGAAGLTHMPTPALGREAWLRRPFGRTLYSITGVTHTTATARTMDSLASLLSAPVEPWDGLICTSKAVRDSLEVLWAEVRADLEGRLGATRLVQPQVATIPLGVNAADFEPQPQARKDWRARLGVPDDSVVALYVGRLNPVGKMNPALMALALEGAARATGRDVSWIVSGWATSDRVGELFHNSTRALCPSVRYLPVDGRPADTRFSIWSAADLFISFSDNVQETFGLTPAEGMAAGLPCVVTDWDGYRETVRHGVDGFRIRTMTPRPGLGADLAYHHANDWVNYNSYIGAAAQFTAIDMAEAVRALSALITDPSLRARMGAAARARVAEALDWSAVIPQYQAFWTELAARRRAASPEPPAAAARTGDPARLDPFRMFAGYPTEALASSTLVSANPDMTWPAGRTLLTGLLGGIGRWAMPSLSEAEAAYERIAAAGSLTVGEVLAGFPPARRPFVERGLLWLAKFEVIRIGFTREVQD